MSVVKLEYIWLDGTEPTQAMRSKTKIIPSSKFTGKIEDLPMWSFDGSSTNQASGGASDCLLKPVFICPDPDRKNGYLVMNEVLNADGTPNSTNQRALINDDDNDFWFGFEQEYFLQDPETGRPLGFPGSGYPKPQGPYYCSVGADRAFGRELIEEHLDICLDAGLLVEGINAEVAAGQWEYQTFAKGAKLAGDQHWVTRYLLDRTAEKYNLVIDYHPKPLGDTDWNGSGMHANFSNTTLRTAGKREIFEEICEKFRPKTRIKDAIAAYGAYNDQRLTGKHETQSIKKFSFGISDRGASMRIPIAVPENGWNGWLEDRRPASNADPYRVAANIVNTVKS